jgi:hypothetical protein
MTYLFLWSFMAYGITSILVWGSIFESFRFWLREKSKFFGDLISCTLCTSTWVGFFLSIVLGGLTVKYFPLNQFFGIFFDGMYTAGTVWAINSIIEFFEEKRVN